MAHLDPEVLSALIDGALPEAQARRARAHLAACSRCRRELEQLEQLRTWLAALPAPEPRRSFTLDRETARRLRRPAWRPWLAWGSAAAALLVVALLALFRTGLGAPGAAPVPAAQPLVKEAAPMEKAAPAEGMRPLGTRPAPVPAATPTPIAEGDRGEETAMKAAPVQVRICPPDGASCAPLPPTASDRPAGVPGGSFLEVRFPSPPPEGVTVTVEPEAAGEVEQRRYGPEEVLRLGPWTDPGPYRIRIEADGTILELWIEVRSAER